MRGTVGLSARLVLLLTVLALVTAACGASDSQETATTTAAGQTADLTTDDTTAAEPESDDALELTTVPLPDGLRPWWESTNRTQAFAESNFLLAAASDVAIRGESPGVTVLRLNAALEWVDVDVAIPPSVTSANMHMSGSQLVISYLDAVGEIVVLSTEDGTAFEETRLALPERYVIANEWAHTSLIGNLAGAADLDGSVFAIANTGIIWTRPIEIAEQYAIEQDPAAAESIRFASTIRTKPTGDGDSLFVFVKNDVVVAEVLGSDAGIQPGYSDAWRDRDDDTFESQSWTIDGTVSTNLNTAPFNGKDGLRIHAIYPVDDGIAAMVTDFNFAEEVAEASQQGQMFAERGLATPDPSAIRTGESEWRFVPWLTNNGIAWISETPLEILNPEFASFAWAVYEGIPLFVLALFADGIALVAASGDGRSYGVANENLDIETNHSGEVTTTVTGLNTVDIYSSGGGSYHVLTISIQKDGSVTSDTKVRSEVSVIATAFEVAFWGSQTNVSVLYVSPVPSMD